MNKPAVLWELGESLNDNKIRIVLATLRHTKGNKEETAKLLRVSIRTVRNFVRRYQE